jgi:hypothetical protein
MVDQLVIGTNRSGHELNDVGGLKGQPPDRPFATRRRAGVSTPKAEPEVGLPEGASLFLFFTLCRRELSGIVKTRQVAPQAIPS